MKHQKLPKRYIRKLISYVLSEKKLLALIVLTGTIGFSITFVFPWLIGSLIDHVIDPRPVNGALPTRDERLHYMIFLTLCGLASAVVVAAAGWGRGHYAMKLGNRIVCSIRRDLFDH